MPPSADAAADMERSVVREIKENGKSGAMKMSDLADRMTLSRKELLDTTNALARKGILSLFTDQNGNSYWHLQSAVEAKKTKDLTAEERVIYGLIRDSKDRGIFKGLMRNRSQMTDQVITKVITKLEGKGLIKQVKDLKKPTQRTYMLMEITPNISLTGGVWFADGAMDLPLVENVVLCLEKHIRAKSVPRKQSLGNIDPKHFIPNPIYPPSHTQKLATPASCLAFVVEKGIAPSLTFAVTDILAVMRVLIYNGKVEVLKPNYTMAHAEGWNSDLENGGGGMDSDEEAKFRKEKKEQEKSRTKRHEEELERDMDKIRKRSKTRKHSRKDARDSDDSESGSDSESESSGDDRSRRKRRSKDKGRKEESKSDKKKRKEKERRRREREEERERERKRRKKSKKVKDESDGGGFSDGSDELVPIGTSSKKRKRKDEKSSRKSKRSRKALSSESELSDSESASDSSDSSTDSSSDDSDKIDTPGFAIGNGGFTGPQEKDKDKASQPGVGFNPFDGFNEEEYNLLDDADVVYRWAVQGSSRMGLSEAPCVRCPTFEFCSEKGPVNPTSCHYFSDWLEPDDIENIPPGARR